MSGPAYYTGVMNISMNEDWIVPFLYATSPDGGVTTTPIDLTGSTLMMEIRHQESDHEVVLSLSSANNQGIYITNATGGTNISADKAANAISPASRRRAKHASSRPRWCFRSDRTSRSNRSMTWLADII